VVECFGNHLIVRRELLLMANDFIRMPADGVGKYTRTASQTVGGTIVHAHYMVLQESGGNEIGTTTDPISINWIDSLGNEVSDDISSITALTENSVKQQNESGVGAYGQLVLSLVNTSAPNYSANDGNLRPPSMDGDGNIRVVGMSVGNAAHDAADAGNPVKIGAKAETALAGITLVADGDRTNLYADADGVQYIKPLCGFGEILQNGGQTVTTTASTAVTNLGATASSYNYVTEVSIWNYSTVDTYIKLQDGNAGTQFWVFPAPALGGCCQTFNVPLKQPTSNTALYMAEGATASGIIVSIKGFQSKL
jgi:hypothetical protein